MARRVVVVVGALSAGCGGAGEHVPIANAPAFEPGAVHEVPPAGAPACTVLNATTEAAGVVYRFDDGCKVFPDDGVVRPPPMMPPPFAIACPPTMQDPAWEACYGGMLIAGDEPGACTCHWFGNPPPPSAEVRCPTHG